jgi:hypothetical protein
MALFIIEKAWVFLDSGAEVFGALGREGKGSLDPPG